MIIYKVTNLINGKIYIGKTNHQLRKRKNDHLSDIRKNRYSIIFHHAIRKYGEECFTWEIIDQCLFPDVLLELEKYYIKKLKSKSPHGYNMTDGGEGVCGHIKTKETIEKIRVAHIGKHLSDDHKRKIGESGKGEKNGFYGKTHSIKTKKKISQAYFKRYKKENHPNFGKHLSEATRRKIGISHKGKSAWNKGIKSNVIPWNKGKRMSQVVCEKIKIAQRKRRDREKNNLS